MIPLKKCEIGVLYKIHSRNLQYGIFNGKDGFIGIRTKFGQKYLFTEFHWDTGPPYGTVKPIEKTEFKISISEINNEEELEDLIHKYKKENE